MAGFATLSGGDTISLALVNPAQVAAVQAAINALNAAYSSDQVIHSPAGHFGSPTTENVINADGGTPFSGTPAFTDAVILDSVNGSAGTAINVSSATVHLIVGNQGPDTITANVSNATVFAGDGSNQISVNSLNFGFSLGNEGSSIWAGDGANNITLLGNGTVTAGNGNDTVSVLNSGGLDSISVGSGNDLISFIGTNGTVTAGDTTGGSDTINFTGSGIIQLGSGNDLVNLNAFAPTTVYAGNGNDTINSTSTSNVSIDVGMGADSITVESSATIIGDGADTIHLGLGSNMVIEYGSATVYGGSGNPRFLTSHSTIDGGAGNFLYYNEGGIDSVTAGSGNSTLVAGAGNETLVGGALGSHAVLNGSTSGANLNFVGGAGSTTMYGGSGSDSFVGGTGSTTMYGGTGDNVFIGSSGENVMDARGVSGTGVGITNDFYGGSGSDTMYADTHHASHAPDPNSFFFNASVGGSHMIIGYDNAPNGDVLNFTGYHLNANQIIADSHDTATGLVITLPGSGGTTTSITLVGIHSIQDWNINAH